MWDLGLAEAPPGLLHYVMYPWIMSPAKLREAGFICSRSSLDALTGTAASAREHVRVGRSRVRRDDLVRGTAAGLGLVGAALAILGDAAPAGSDPGLILGMALQDSSCYPSRLA